MKKIITSLCVLILLLMSISTIILAAESENISIKILSPDSASGIPGLDQTIKTEIKNNTDKPIEGVMVYITMADLSKHMTVNLEDYGASTPIVVGTLNSKETKVVELPVRLVYVSKFYLYTTVVSSNSPQIVSSNAIPIEITGNSMIDRGVVQVVSIFVPVIILIGVLLVLFIRKRTISEKNL